MYKWFLGGIFVLAFLLRIINLANLPAGLTPDEASFGYDAYTLIKTGKDQWGKPWPLTFKSFGDYKLPVYTYISIPTVYIFGLNEFSVRLPNAIFGSLAVIATFLLVSELLNDKKYGKVALLSALFLAVSPWHIALSRGAFEANLTTFFMTFGMWIFLKARKNDSLLPLSMLFFGFNLFTYHSSRIVTPLIVMALLWMFRKSFPRRKKYSLASAVFLLFFIGAIVSLLQGGGARAATSTIFGQNLGSGVIRANLVNSGLPVLAGKLLYNEPSFKLGKFVSNYISYLAPSFFFTEGAHETTYGMVPGVAIISIFELLGVAVFMWSLSKERSSEIMILVFWILIGVIPASISVGPGNAANRAAVLMPAMQIIAAVGCSYLFRLIPKANNLSYAFYSLIVFIGLLSFVRYSYEQPAVAGPGMMTGMHELFDFLDKYPTKHVIISRSLSEPHIYAAFYDPIYPSLYQKATKNWNFEEKNLAWVDQQEGYFLGRYVVSSIDKIRDFQYADTFVVGKREEMPSDARIVKSILSPVKSELWVVAEKP